MLRLYLYARVRHFSRTFAHETAGAASTRHSLRPLLSGREDVCKTSGETRRENAKVCLVERSDDGGVCIRSVMPGLDPGIHVFLVAETKAWMAGSSPAMTPLLGRE
jgi:hypothetical protein